MTKTEREESELEETKDKTEASSRALTSREMKRSVLGAGSLKLLEGKIGSSFGEQPGFGENGEASRSASPARTRDRKREREGSP